MTAGAGLLSVLAFAGPAQADVQSLTLELGQTSLNSPPGATDITTCTSSSATVSTCVPEGAEPQTGVTITARAAGTSTITITFTGGDGSRTVNLTVVRAGAACQWDGKINGRGATFALKAHEALFRGYRDDVCGRVSPDSGDVPESGNAPYPVFPRIPDPFHEMGIYNYPDAATRTPPLTGSGSGQNGALCRTDAFNGTDTPYSIATLALLRGAPPLPTASACTPFNGGFGGNAAIPFNTPFSPTGAPYPHPSDVQAPIMSFPIAGGAVTIPINLDATPTCTAPPTNVQLTSRMVSLLFGGDLPANGGSILNWNDSRLRLGAGGATINATLASCDKLVTRVVRADSSGTTTIFKNYLSNVNGAVDLCDPTIVPAGANNWTALAGRNTAIAPNNNTTNVSWPGMEGTGTPLAQPNGTGPNGQPAAGQCAPFLRGSGNPGVIATVVANDGAVGYVDLAEALPETSVLLATVRNATDTAYVSPRSGTASNCSFGGTSMPGTTANDSVGITGNAWASDAAPNFSDPTNRGATYAICGFTWDLVYTGLSKGTDVNPEATDVFLPSAIARLDEDQRMTLYSFFTYVLSPLGQAKLGPANYAALPPGFLTRLRTGFQANL